MGDRLPKFKAAAIQASPVFLDREATTEKGCELIARAADSGANLVVFPEAWIPTFPYWPRALPHPNRGKSIEAYLELFKNAVEIPGRETRLLCSQAKQSSCYVVMGLNEKEKSSTTMYNTLLYISKDGTILGKNRKLVPTFEERCIWGYGDGTDLKVFDTELGKISGLICGNNQMTLAKYALFAKGEQIHVSVWPNLLQMVESVSVTNRALAMEGRVFVIVSCGYMTADMVPDSFPLKKETLWKMGGGSGIISPDGKYVAGPAGEEETIVYAEIDLEDVIRGRAQHDVVGHYSRPDILTLLIKEEAYSQMKTVPSGSERILS